jgi:hypothetical protein
MLYPGRSPALRQRSNDGRCLFRVDRRSSSVVASAVALQRPVPSRKREFACRWRMTAYAATRWRGVTSCRLTIWTNGRTEAVAAVDAREDPSGALCASLVRAAHDERWTVAAVRSTGWRADAAGGQQELHRVVLVRSRHRHDERRGPQSTSPTRRTASQPSASGGMHSSNVVAAAHLRARSLGRTGAKPRSSPPHLQPGLASSVLWTSKGTTPVCRG